ncbi:MAG: 50S ribosomal protein L25/general stress protein Ctc [Sulfuriflexus sp.]|nr:50S ribosomal protein L25/general stress protein Ctc [Sulfuriflexus sp.]
MSVTFELDAEVRTDEGKGASRRLRHANKIPAVMYGGGSDPISLTMDHNKMAHALENEAFYSHILTINIDGKAEKAVLRDLQRHPAKMMILHADFQRVNMKEKLHMHVPLHFINEDIAPGVKDEGGRIQHNVVEVEVSCLPANLPEYIEVDVADLAMDHSLHLSDIKMADGVELVQLALGESHDLPIVSIHKPRAVVEEVEEVEAEAGEDAAEGDSEEAKD